MNIVKAVLTVLLVQTVASAPLKAQTTPPSGDPDIKVTPMEVELLAPKPYVQGGPYFALPIPKSVQIENIGTGILDIGIIEILGDPFCNDPTKLCQPFAFAASTGLCDNNSLAAGETCHVSVTMSDSFSGIPKTAALAIHSNDPDTPLTPVILTELAPGACTNDNDGDGFFPPGGQCNTPADCNDNDPTINPEATEVVDNIDNNCDGLVDDVTASPHDHTNNIACDDCHNNSPGTIPTAANLYLI